MLLWRWPSAVLLPVTPLCPSSWAETSQDLGQECTARIYSDSLCVWVALVYGALLRCLAQPGFFTCLLPHKAEKEGSGARWHRVSCMAPLAASRKG